MRLGRELEIVVSLIEGALSGVPVTIRSPEYVVGRRSGQRREVDVSIRGRLGSAEIFVAVECRDRSVIQGLDWIEQVKSKQDDVGASRMVVVCSSAFTEPAIRAAEALGISLRTLSEISGPEILTWMDPSLTHVEVTYRRVEIVSCTSDLSESAGDVEELPGSAPRIDLTTPVFRRTRDGALMSPWDVWQSLPTQKLYEPPTGPDRRLVKVEANYTNPDDLIRVQIRGQWYDLARVRFEAWVWIETVRLPIRTLRYVGSEGGDLSEGFDCEVEGPSGLGRMAITLNPTPQGGSILSAGYRPYAEQDDGPASSRPPVDFADLTSPDG